MANFERAERHFALAAGSGLAACLLRRPGLARPATRRNSAPGGTFVVRRALTAGSLVLLVLVMSSALTGTTLEPETAPPRGHWIVCGYGRFGREVVKAFREHGLDVTVIDPGERPVDGLPTTGSRGPHDQGAP